MLNTSQLETGWQDLVNRVGSTEELEASAKESGALARRRGIRSAADLLRLAMAYGPCGKSLRETAAWARKTGLGELSDVAVLKRLRGAPPWLEELVGNLLARRFGRVGPTGSRPVRLVESMTVGERSGERASWRLHCCYDPRTGRCVECELMPARGGERLRRVKVAAGDIWLGDRGTARGEGLASVVQAGADFVVPIGADSLALRTSAGNPFDLAARLAKLDKGGEARWQAIADTPDGKTVPIRVLAQRKASDTILATSLDEPAHRIFDLHGVRQQIDIVFTRLESLLQADRLEAKDSDLVKTWILAHILAVLIEDDSGAL